MSAAVAVASDVSASAVLVPVIVVPLASTAVVPALRVSAVTVVPVVSALFVLVPVIVAPEESTAVTPR